MYVLHMCVYVCMYVCMYAYVLCSFLSAEFTSRDVWRLLINLLMPAADSQGAGKSACIHTYIHVHTVHAYIHLSDHGLYIYTHSWKQWKRRWWRWVGCLGWPTGCHIHTFSYIHTFIHTNTHTYIHTYIHTYMHYLRLLFCCAFYSSHLTTQCAERFWKATPPWPYPRPSPPP